MIEIDGKYHVRRYGLLVQRELTCIYGHRIKPGGTPFEIAVPCHVAVPDIGRSIRDDIPRCEARLYVFTTRGTLLWAMDMTAAEALMVLKHSLNTAEIVDYFGVGFPVDMRITRLGA